MSVTAALIVRNESATLARCLDSIQRGVDQIVVVDTGSEDDTREIARRYTSEVSEFRWVKDFAAARQHSFDRARGDWVCWFDADDVVANAEHIRDGTLHAAADVCGFYWKYVVGEDGYGNSTCELWRERCVRKSAGFRWQGRVHEVLVPRGPARLVRDASITVHHRPLPRSSEHQRRNLDILESEYAATRAAPQPRLLLYLGNEYVDHGRYAEAVDFLQRYLAVATWDDEKYLAQLRVAALYRLLGNYDASLDASLRALKIHPHWPMAHFSLGETYYFLQDWPKVVHWCESGQAMPVPETLCIVQPLAYRYDWIIHYSNALFHVGRVAEGLEWTNRALGICPHETWHLENARFFASILAGGACKA